LVFPVKGVWSWFRGSTFEERLGPANRALQDERSLAALSWGQWRTLLAALKKLSLPCFYNLSTVGAQEIKVLEQVVASWPPVQLVGVLEVLEYGVFHPTAALPLVQAAILPALLARPSEIAQPEWPNPSFVKTANRRNQVHTLHMVSN